MNQRRFLGVSLGVVAVTLITLAVQDRALADAGCSATSGSKTVPLIELYTSEGCSSCPPADRFMSSLRGTKQIVPLAFHVDYWDYIGWQDRFGDRRYSQRQRALARHQRLRTVYTPQFVVNGKDTRGGPLRQRIQRGIERAATTSAPASLSLAVRAPSVDRIDVEIGVIPQQEDVLETAELWLAVYENNLGSEVSAGENRGRALEHDFVVRDLRGPLRLTAREGSTTRVTITQQAGWKRHDLGVAAFLQETGHGAVLQAVAAPVACAGD